MPKRKTVNNPHARKRARQGGRARKAAVTTKTFPASERTPGQARSRASFEALQEKREQCKEWWDDFLRLMSENGLDWRKAAYVAWASSPVRDRWPPTVKELAEQVLGCSDRVVRKWRQLNPQLEALIAKFQAEPLLRHRRDIFDALVGVATWHDPQAHSDRKLALQLLGDYKPRGALEVSGDDGGPVGIMNWGDIGQLDEDGLDRLIINLTTIQAAAGRGADGEIPPPAGAARRGETGRP